MILFHLSLSSLFHLLGTDLERETEKAMGRAPCCDKAKVKRGPWSPEEDDTLKAYLLSHGTGGNWIALPAKAGLKRCGKSCRLRWLNYLRPDIKHGGFTPEEDRIICTYYNQIGSRWAVIASQLPGRTDNDVKNYWNTKLKKKLLSGNIVPTTTTTNLNNNNNYSSSSSSSPLISSFVPKDKKFLVSPTHHQISGTYSPVPAVTDEHVHASSTSWYGLNYNPDLYRPVQPPPSDLDYHEFVSSQIGMINVVSQEGSCISSDSSSLPAMPSISGGANSIADQDFGFAAFPYDIWYPNMADLTLNTNQY